MHHTGAWYIWSNLSWFAFCCFYVLHSHFPIILCIGDPSWLHLTPLRKCGSPRKNMRKIVPAPSTGRHFKWGVKGICLPHLSGFTSLSFPRLASLCSLSPLHLSRQGNLPGFPFAARHAFSVPCPASRWDTRRDWDRARLGIPRPFCTHLLHQTPKSFAGHQSILLTVVSFEANAYIQRLNIYYTIYPALYDIVISLF